MATAVQSAAAELAAIVGEARVVSDAAACASLAVDGMVPNVVVYPASAEEVAGVLKCAAERDLAVMPCRNATKLSIGNPPRRYDVALSLKEMNRVWHYEPADLTVSVEPGMKFGDLQHLFARDGLWLPLDPAGGARASVGGILATNSSGPLRLLYGAPRDILIGMKVATTEGKIVKTGGKVVKNVAGYDLAKLLIGSCGSLGVIVEASFKLYPLPPERATFVFEVESLEVARDLRRRILNSPLTPMRMTLLDAAALRAVGDGSRAAAGPAALELWVEVGGSERVIGRSVRELEGLGTACGAPLRRLEGATAQDAWSRLADFRSVLVEAYPSVIILKTILPLDASENFLALARERLEAASARPATLTQAGVGVVHLCLLDGDAPTVPDLTLALRRAAESLGGAMVVERASPELKKRIDVWGAPGDDFEIMRKIKNVWDPKGILAPGRFLGGI